MCKTEGDKAMTTFAFRIKYKDVCLFVGQTYQRQFIFFFDLVFLITKPGNGMNNLVVKGIDQFWSCGCIVKEMLWNRSEKVDHLLLVLVCTASFWNHQNDKKFGPVLLKLQALYTERCIWDYPISIQSG